MRLTTTITFILSIVFLTGCGGGGRKMPAGMPKLYPVSISVTQEGKPLADASVSLRYADPSAGTWAVGGKTDATGIVKLRTDGFPGAPVGKFKVVLIKQDNEGMEEYAAAGAQGDTVAASKVKVKIWSCVKEEYNDPKKTPLEVEITASTQTLEVDAGPAVKIEQPFVP